MTVTRPGDWTRRRRIIQWSLWFCAGVITYVVLFPGDAITAPTRGSIAQALIAFSGSVVGSYVFGAIWDDANKRAQENKP